MIRPPRPLAQAAAFFALLAGPARAGDLMDRGELHLFPGPIQSWLETVRVLPWSIGCVSIIALILTVARRLRLRRRDMRRTVLGLSNGPRFRAVDAMCHAVWKGRGIHPKRLKRALEIARSLTDMDFTEDHLREAAQRADRIIIPINFRWMRKGLTQGEKMVVFNAALSVLLAEAPLSPSDRAFLMVLARGLGLKRDQLRGLSALLPA
ncbi:hypothetical protein [Jannaschia ovalis]|uniref:Tellurite resistance protein TerB n=1 Tax=Jannaschia ovalis TaxID=3038773 RepID=A0ABY8LJ05_9RHOB|nr:hypothetical protein [Jannaschia sp. GRR-S6-38]WGH80098.1 hypothetical protein P8627_07490 [Jannaschia sp. GRR-S6-38]